MIDIEDELTAMLRTRAARVDPPIRINEITHRTGVAASISSPEDSVVGLVSESGTRRPKHRVALLATTAASLVLLVVGIAVVSDRGTERDAQPSTSSDASPTNQPEPQPVPAGSPALLEPVASQDVVTVQRGRTDGLAFDNGAVIGPDGTVFGLTLYPTTPIGDEFAFDTKTIGGLSASAVVDGTAPEQIYTNIEIGCATVAVTTAGEAMWSPAIETLAGAITMVDDTVMLDLPSGWASLGSAAVNEIYSSELSSTTDGTIVQVSMRQAVGVPIGFFLSTMETPPVDVSNGDETLWHVASATTPGYNTIVGERNGTAFSITAQAPLGTLTTVLAELVAIPADGWLQQATDESAPLSTSEVGSEEGPSTECELAALAVTTQ